MHRYVRRVQPNANAFIHRERPQASVKKETPTDRHPHECPRYEDSFGREFRRAEGEGGRTRMAEGGRYVVGGFKAG